MSAMSQKTTKKGVIIRMRQSRVFKGMAVCVALNLVAQVVQPSLSLALTEGPSQPEVQSFEPIGTTQMVDLFSGDFNYNIPLFNLPGPNGGYPVNLAYHAGVSMDDEASWVGLGWNINVGSLNRNLRGLPDDFQTKIDASGEYDSGDFVYTKNDRKDSWTVGASMSGKFELFGADAFNGFSPSLSIRYNNYAGMGAGVGISSIGNGGSPFNYGISLDSDNGLGVSAKFSILDKTRNFDTRYKFGISFDGDLSVDYGIGLSTFTDAKKAGGGFGFVGNYGSSISFARSSFSPSLGLKSKGFSISANLSLTKAGMGFMYASQQKHDGTGTIGLFYNQQGLHDEMKEGVKRPVLGYEANGTYSSDYYTKDFVREKDGQITKSSPILGHAHYTYDTYSSTGQGLSGMFRPKRSDVGYVNDPRVYSTNWGITANLEIAEFPTGEPIDIEASQEELLQLPPSLFALVLAADGVYTQSGNQLGAGFHVSQGWSSQNGWHINNDLDFDFKDPYPGDIKENLIYQAGGEMTILDPDEYTHILGTDLVALKMTPKESDGLSGGKRNIKASQNPTDYAAERIVADEDRVVRNTLIHTLKNEEVANLGEFNFSYITWDENLDLRSPSSVANNSAAFTRENREMTDFGTVSIAHHNAGYKVLNEDGSYYVYALPAYNLKQVESQFSVDSDYDGTGSSNELTLDPDDASIINHLAYTSGEVDYEKNLTDKVLNKSITSPYAHSYMLTSVQGADYVDISNNGPSDDDLGYWVKFDYVQYSNSWKWRAPYYGAQYVRGESYTGEDDMGAYQYGEKEQWFLGRIETKTHIAVFEMSERDDMKEAVSEYAGKTDSEANGGDLDDNQSGLKVDKIYIYDKASYNSLGANATPLQTIHFEYDYSQCLGTKNSTSANYGKLTLKKVWFTSNGSSRGALAPYEFDYEETYVDYSQTPMSDLTDPLGTKCLINPDYAMNEYDPWGQYHPYSEDYRTHLNFPYMAQTRNSWGQDWMSSSYLYETEEAKEYQKTANDLIASAWCLRKITLPSGGVIKIDYESDDYSHVQHKVANQMFKIVSTGESSQIGDDELYSISDDINFSTSVEYRKIYFELEEPIPTSTTLVPDPSLKVYEDYVEPIITDEGGIRNLYFKARVHLVDPANSLLGSQTDVYEMISGYLPLENYSSTYYGADTEESIDGVNCYTRGWVTIQCAKKKNGSEYTNYHPISLMAWQYMQTNAPKLLNPVSAFNSQSGGAQTVGDVVALVANVFTAIPTTMSSYGALRPYCRGLNFAQNIDLSESGIRLASPDRKKFGGGHRVRNISITDNWNSDTGNQTSNTYGQHFDYTTTDEDGRVISSGVAQYEPQAGGDENALKYPIYFYGRTSYFSNNNLFAEGPVDEALFPGPMVGYRKVTVTSLNTQYQYESEKETTGNGKGRTGGVSVHEFYTAKEFPTLTEHNYLSESANTMEVSNVPIPIPFIGMIKRNYYHGTQAFKIELNDMHGKPKAVRTYEMFNYEPAGNPIAESIYEYQMEPYYYQGENVYRLNNEVSILPNDGTHRDVDNLNGSPILMGVTSELFTDQRENKSFNFSAGLDFNLVFPVIPSVPLIIPWPAYSQHKTMFRTYVTNKVVHRSGILKRTISRDLQATNEMEVVAYDEKAGTPILTKMKNQFGDTFYDYKVPAYYHYDRMGHAYRNINYEFCATVYKASSENYETRANVVMDFPATGAMLDYLVRGDELLVTSVNGSSTDQDAYRKGYFLGWTYNNGSPYGKIQILDSYQPQANDDYCFKVIRSGRRNHYGAVAESYVSMGKLDIYDGNNAIITTNVGPSGSQVTTPEIQSNVLSASASLYKDDWATTSDPLDDYTGVTSNPFRSGNSGIWRPYKAYSYVGERSSEADLDGNISSYNDPNLSQDGLMSLVPMFTYKIGNIEISDPDLGWEWVNEVTQFTSDAYEIENVNRLGIHSSALYGYDNALSIGVGGNADRYELGVYDFETSQNFGRAIAQTNMNFHVTPGVSSLFRTDHFNVTKAVMGANNTIVITTDATPSELSMSNYEDNLAVTLVSREGLSNITNEGFYFNGNGITAATNGDGYVELTFNPYLENDQEPWDVLEVGAVFYGKVSLLANRDFENINVSSSTVELSTTKAHTGKQSLKISQTVAFEQPMLRIESGKSYVLSMWVSRDNSDVVDFDPASLVKIGYVNSGTFVETTGSIFSVPAVTKSKIVEGWQKIDLEFTADVDNQTVAIQFVPGTYGLYVDDIRFSPKTGGITTYVYDPVKFWLRASLNVDNYATFFYYDEAGNLVLKKIETEEGIQTITESRAHVSEN